MVFDYFLLTNDYFSIRKKFYLFKEFYSSSKIEKKIKQKFESNGWSVFHVHTIREDMIHIVLKTSKFPDWTNCFFNKNTNELMVEHDDEDLIKLRSTDMFHYLKPTKEFFSLEDINQAFLQKKTN